MQTGRKINFCKTDRKINLLFIKLLNLNYTTKFIFEYKEWLSCPICLKTFRCVSRLFIISCFLLFYFQLFEPSPLGFKFVQWCFARRFIRNFQNPITAIAARFCDSCWRYVVRIERHVDFADDF